MAKTYLATQAEVSAVEQKADTANTAINATDTGLAALDTKIDGLVTKTDTADTKVTALEVTVGDDTSGLVKAVNDLDASINAAGGIDERVTDLEVGGTTTMKFRTHSTSGVYEDGEVVQRTGLLYKANGVIDGSVTPVPFVEGPLNGQFFPLGKPAGAVGTVWNNKLDFNRALISDSSGNIDNSTVTTTELSRLAGVSDSVQTQLNKKAEKAFSINPTSTSVAVVDTNGKLLYSPTVSVDELDYLDGVTSSVQTQLDNKPEKGYIDNPNELRVAYVNSSGQLAYSGTINDSELVHLNGVTSNIQTQLNGKVGAPSHFTVTQYGSDQGVVIGTTEPNLVFKTMTDNEVYISGGGSVRPFSAKQDLGSSSTSQRWQTLYLKNSPNVSSDARLKTNLRDIPNELLDVWFQYVKPTAYELISNQGNKTNRIEVGMIAQDVIAAFEAAGLDWHEWNVVCVKDDFDNQDDMIGETDDVDYYSLNYTACQLIESMAIRRKLGI